MAFSYKWLFPPTSGINRDQTNLSASATTNLCLDGIWTRFYENKPKKIGGYKVLQNGDEKIIRDVFTVLLDDQGDTDVYVGRSDSLKVFRTTTDGLSSVPRNRTPVGFPSDPNNIWSFATVTYDGIVYILACAIPALDNINNSTQNPIYYGRIDSDDPLTPILEDDGVTPIVTAGGVTVIGSIIVVYDKNGELFWNSGTAIDKGILPTAVWPSYNSAIFGSENFVFGDPIRNGNTLGGLFWATKGLAKMSFIGLEIPEVPADGPQPVFDISYVSPACTIFSSSSVVYYDPYYYWIGNKVFYRYTGVVEEIPNTTNKNYFFDNILTNNQNKVFGFANYQYNEIWWGWAKGLTSTTVENNAALLLNNKTMGWGDTPNFYRTCGIQESTYLPYPIMCSSDIVRTPSDTYPVWFHEFGTDININGSLFALPASIQFKYIDNQNYNALVLDDLILDIQQSGNMTVQVSKQGYPRSTVLLSDPIVFSPTQEHITFREKGNLLSLIFTSNEVGGDFLFGQCIANVTGDETERPGPVNA